MYCVRPLFQSFAHVTQSVRCLSMGVNKFIDMTGDEHGIAVMTFHRPPVNSINLEVLEEMTKLLDEIDTKKYRGLVLTSAQPSTFIAGLDIMELYKPDMKRAEAFLKACHEVWLKLFGAGFVTAAAINGHAPAAGCLLALACEYRAMVQGKFRVGLNEAALGIIANPFIMDTMLHVIPVRQAELALTSAKMFTVDEALEVGIIDDTAHDNQEAINKCKMFIKKFDNISPTVRSIVKQRFREEPMRKLRENRQQDVDLFLNFLRNPEVQANIENYMQRLKDKSHSK